MRLRRRRVPLPFATVLIVCAVGGGAAAQSDIGIRDATQIRKDFDKAYEQLKESDKKLKLEKERSTGGGGAIAPPKVRFAPIVTVPTPADREAEIRRQKNLAIQRLDKSLEQQQRQRLEDIIILERSR